jgi:hypothetical protein
LPHAVLKRETDKWVSESIFGDNVFFLKSLTVLLSASATFAMVNTRTLASTRMERVSKMVDDSFIFALFDSKKDGPEKMRSVKISKK